MFAFDEKNRASSSVSNPITAISEHTVLGSPPIKFARRVPIKISPPQKLEQSMALGTWQVLLVEEENRRLRYPIQSPNLTDSICSTLDRD